MRWRQIGLLGAVLGVGAFAGWHVLHGAATAHAAGPDPHPQVPVTTTMTKVQDVPVYLDGLGTVQAYNIDEIKAQVNGILTAVPVREGQEVRKGDIVAEIDPTPYKAALDQAIAQRAEDNAQLQSARLDLQRYQNLAKKSFAPIQQVDDQQATVNKLAAAVQLDNAAIETAQFNLSNCTIRAPINGRVSLYQTDVGNLIEVSSQTTGIVSITQDKPIAVVFTLPESELGQVQTAMARGKVPVIATNSQDSNKILGTGTLLTPDNTISTATGTISLKAKFDNPQDHLWPGQFVDTRTQVTTLHDAVTVNTLAVQHGPDGLFVYVVKPDQTVAQQPVQVGYQDDGISVVSKGLTGNETVVLSGQSRLAPGVRVAAMMQQSSQTADTSGSGSAS
ncbi:MAG TPA: efflux RND transporter periplasmic adaptor subunit [Acetobacteraceae bacterium]|nr:efflux RND transporter periplasmic adaptor subunit [Acetobacteraceae bacterium]